MQEQYIAHIKQPLLQFPKELFFQFLDYFEIKELKKFPDFEALKQNILGLALDPQEFFETACLAIHEGKLATLEFLIDGCGYDLKNIVGKKKGSLLHEACIWGNVEIVKYLLEKEFDPNKKDEVGNTPLHSAIQSPNQKKSPEIIALLKEYHTDLNALGTTSQIGPLHLTVLYKNNFAQKKLIQLKANPKILWDGLNYLDLGKAIQKGEVGARMEDISLSLPDQTVFEKSVCEYYRGCFSAKFNPAFFLNVKAWLMKKSEKLNKLEINYLGECQIKCVNSRL